VCSDLLLYHVDERYENGLSLPMYCGSSSKEESGAFVEHDKWGPLYVMTEDRKNGESVLLVFKLNDGLKYLERRDGKQVDKNRK